MSNNIKKEDHSKEKKISWRKLEKREKIYTGFIDVLLLAVYIFTVKGEKSNPGWAVGTFLLMVVVGVMPYISVELSARTKKYIQGGWGISAPFCACVLMECYRHVAWDMSVPIFCLNLIFYYLVYIFCVFVLGSMKRGGIVATIFMMLVGTANYYTVKFRSTPILPWDLLSIKTAASVTNNFTFSISYRLLLISLCYILMICIFKRMDVFIKRKIYRLSAGVLSAVGIVIFSQIVQTDKIKEAFDLDDTLFTPNYMYQTNGFFVAFLANLQYISIKEPNGYSLDYVLEETEQTENASAIAGEVKSGENKPNIIVVMNEAFSDLSVLGDFGVNEDYMPYIRSLKGSDNAITGNLFVSVKGGNTANTEFEFLTGDSMAFLPAGSVPYQQYITGEIPTLVQQMNDLGYTTIAMHPYSASGWDRDEVYEWFGFDQMIFKEGFQKEPFNHILRKYVDDESAYNKIISAYESKGEDERLFTFEVTMQNHSGYSKSFEGFEPDIELTDSESPYKTWTQNYLSLIKISDEAFKGLTTYFSNQKEPTIILMFGDHQPSDYIAKPVLELNGTEEDNSLEAVSKRYEVPFVLWANYDIEPQTIDQISVNYLSTLLVETAGIEKTPYQEFLSELYKKLPVVTANFAIDTESNIMETDDEEIAEDMNEYAIFQYNHLFDTKNRQDEFFTIPDHS